MKTIYLAGPISGLTFEEASIWRKIITPALELLGYEVFNPLTGKEFLIGKGIIGADTSQNLNVLAHHDVIYNVDMFRVRQSDILLINFHNCKIVSIGTVAEINLAHETNKLVIMVMDENNIHNHPFITQRSIVLKTMEEAVAVLQNI